MYFNDADKGRKGTRFFLQNSGELLKQPVLFYDMGNINKLMDEQKKLFLPNFVGLDLYGICLPEKSQKFEWNPEEKWQPNIGEIPGRSICCEVKTICGKDWIGGSSFLRRTNDRSEESGTLEFELFANNRDKNGSKKPRSEWVPGWLHGCMFPEEHQLMNVYRESLLYEKTGIKRPLARAVKPDMLVYILCDDETADRPFAVIAFENFHNLAERLIEIAPQEWSLKNWGLPPANNERYWKDQKTVIDNIWHVSLNLISDLATITMIGNDPPTGGSKGCSEELQKRRLEFLKAHSEGRRIALQDTVSQVQSDNGSDLLYSTQNISTQDFIRDNVAILHAIQDDPETYPSLHRAFSNKQSSLLAHLLHLFSYMLSKPNPFQTDTSGHEYWKIPVSYLVAQYGGTFETWQSHLIFFLDTGLLRRIKPDALSRLRRFRVEWQKASAAKRASTSCYSPVPFTPAVLEHANQVAEQYRTAGVSLSHITKTDVIRVSGQHRADMIYRSRDVIGDPEHRMRSEIQKRILAAIQACGYARWDEVSTRFYRETCPDFQLMDDKLYRAYMKTLKRKKSVCHEINCSYHPPRHEDRERFGLQDHGWIITYDAH